jgi:adenylyltransferase/sulfurtransferase
MDRDIVRCIKAFELSKLLEEKADILIIDVREADEIDICCIGGQHIPLGQIDVKASEIPRDKQVVIHCKSGKRGEMAVLFLQQNHQFTNLFNLEGGILSFSDLDPTLTIY